MLARTINSASLVSPKILPTASLEAFVPAPTRLGDHPLLGTPEHAVFYICDNDGRITHSNQAFMELAAEVGTVTTRTTTPPAFPLEPIALKTIMRQIVDRRTPVIREEPFILGGEQRRFRSIHMGLYGDDNRLVGAAGVYQDAEGEAGPSSAITRLRERFDDITQLSSDWIWETDTQFRLTYLSSRVTDVLGFLPRELEGKNLQDLGIFEPGGRNRSFDWTSPFRDTPFQISDRDGNPRRFLLSGLPYYCTNTGAYLGTRGTARNAGDTYEFSPRESAQPRDIGLEDDLRRAVERGQMHLRYHPMVDLITGQVTGVEALLRWAHPQRGELAPDEFIPMAEATGVIVPLGEWVLRTACRQASQWRQENLPPVRMGINISPAQFCDTDLVDTVRRALQDSGLDPNQLELEITEGMVVNDSESVMETLGALRRLGVNLAIDDFGTGYSSLSYLQRLPVNRVKIDRQFVSDICTNGGNAAITRAIITLCHDLGFKVIAEGVETPAQLDHLKRNSCDEAQGFHFTRPLTGEQISHWVRAHSVRCSNRRTYRTGGRHGRLQQHQIRDSKPGGLDYALPARRTECR